jgi:hypothetical protein
MDNVICDKDMGDTRRAIPLLLQPFVYTSEDNSEKQKMIETGD